MSRDRFKRTRWKEGMVFAVPLSNGKFGIAQAVTNYMPNVVYVALFSDLFDQQPMVVPALRQENVISLAATWKQDLNNGSWAKLGIEPVLVPKEQFPNEKYAKNGYVGAINVDAGLLEEFLSAYHGLKPWNIMYEEDYWETYLAPDVTVPNTAVILNEEDRESYRKELLSKMRGA